MNEPTILRFPAATLSAAVPKALPAADQVDLQTILAAWNEATDRLHERAADPIGDWLKS